MQTRLTIITLYCSALIFGSIQFSYSQPDKYRFSHITTDDGLSNNQVRAIMKDSRGFIWVGTLSGLNRYDGHKFKIYKREPYDTTSLLDNTITELMEDGNGNIWIKTFIGYCKFDPVYEKFYRYVNINIAGISYNQKDVLKLFTDKNGNIWYSVRNSGVFKYSIGEKKFIHLKNNQDDESTIHLSDVSGFREDSKGNLWIVHYNGIIEKIDPEELKVTEREKFLNEKIKGLNYNFSIFIDSEDDIWVYTTEAPMSLARYTPGNKQYEFIEKGNSKFSMNSDLITSIVEDDYGKIWVGTDHGGINVIDKKNRKIEYITHDSKSEQSLSQLSITCIYKDPDGPVWIGTYKQGINFYHEKLFLFNAYVNDPSDPNSLGYNDVNCYCEDKNKNLYIGTNGGGLIFFNRKENTFKSIFHDKNNINSLSNNVVVTLLKDSKGIIWAGTYYGGLNKYDGKKFVRYMHDPENNQSLSDNRVWDIFEDSKNNLWIGTLGGGLLLFQREHNVFINYSGSDSGSVRSDYILTINEDSYGNLWIGTGNGIFVIKEPGKEVRWYEHSESDLSSLSNNLITTMHTGEDGRMWIGTSDGIDLYNPVDNSFIKFRTEQGLPDNTILSIEKDNNGDIWFATSKGITRLSVVFDEKGNIKDHAIVNYDKDNGIINQGFNERSAFKTSSGELVFGGTNGFYIFKPENINEANIKPLVYIVGFEVQGKPLTVNSDNKKQPTLRKSLLYTDEIELNYSDNIFSIEFAALAYLNAERIQYRYKLEGFNDEWLNTDYSERKVTFTNLDPGNYTFKVQAYFEGSDETISEANLALLIKPPFWKSNAAITFYILLVIGLLLIFRQVLLMRERLKYQNEQAKMETRRQQELNAIKTRFFTNVSHEFRTPLTLIISPLERLKKKYNDQAISKELNIIHSNARRLLGLINQLLDFRKMEEQRLSINLDYGNVVKFLEEVHKSFTDLALSKEINYEFKTFTDKFFMRFDEDKLEKVLFNLLSNAFKFTNKCGSISVEINLLEKDSINNPLNNKQTLLVQVKDTGIGIPKENHDKIFERFFQNEQPTGLLSKGSGVGLSLTQEFIKLHDGFITVESEVDKGSTFNVYLPVNQERLEESYRERQNEKAKAVQNQNYNEESTYIHSGKHDATILLVEDNEDFRFYLRDNLRVNYKILEASDGKEAIEVIHQHIPDLIVSDLMMPEINGIELCKKIKEDEKTSHIPFVLLTASLTRDLEIQGFKSGTDAYITKPFSFEILESRIRNLLLRREQMKKSYQKNFKIEPGAIGITSLDEKLMNKALKFVEENLMDSDLSVERLSSELGFSRVHLYKKMSSITGKTPVEFIRLVRLKRAAQLLRESQLTVSEIAYQVGFTDPRYFSKIFKAEYRKLPSQYKAEHAGSHIKL